MAQIIFNANLHYGAGLKLKVLLNGVFIYVFFLSIYSYEQPFRLNSYLDILDLPVKNKLTFW